VSTFCFRRRHSPHDRFFLSMTGFVEGWDDGIADIMRASAVDRAHSTGEELRWYWKLKTEEAYAGDC